MNRQRTFDEKGTVLNKAETDNELLLSSYRAPHGSTMALTRVLLSEVGAITETLVDNYTSFKSDYRSVRVRFCPEAIINDSLTETREESRKVKGGQFTVKTIMLIITLQNRTEMNGFFYHEDHPIRNFELLI